MTPLVWAASMPTDLRTTRLAAGLSQSEAARLIGVSVRTLQDWETRQQVSIARPLATRLLALLTRQERLPAWRRPQSITAPPPASPGSPESAP